MWLILANYLQAKVITHLCVLLSGESIYLSVCLLQLYFPLPQWMVMFKTVVAPSAWVIEWKVLEQSSQPMLHKWEIKFCCYKPPWFGDCYNSIIYIILTDTIEIFKIYIEINIFYGYIIKINMMPRTAHNILYIDNTKCNESIMCHDLDSIYLLDVTISMTGTMIYSFFAFPAPVTRTQ